MNLWSKGEGWNKSMEYGVKEKDGMNLWTKGEGWNESMK